MFDTDGKRNWRSNWLQLIAHLANANLQQERWCHPERYPSAYWSFTEFMCMYFDDLALDEGYCSAVESGLVTEEEFAAVAHFHGKLCSYRAPGGNDFNHAAILSDPNWSEVVRAANGALVALERLALSEPDRQAIRGAA